MNYYKHHLGDYAAATRHLSLLEHGVYRMLLDIYYSTEKPLPHIEKTFRLVVARTKEERSAVESVLEEFFRQNDDGSWSHDRCDSEIYEAKSKADKSREVGKLGGRPRKTETQQVSENNLTGFDPVGSKKNPSHKPIANSQGKPEVLASGVHPPSVGTPGGAVCARLKSDGITDVNPQHPKLLALLDAGLTVDEIASIGPEARQKGKGFAWILAAAEGRRREAANVTPLPAQQAKARASPFPLSQHQESLKAAGKAIFGDLENHANHRIIDITPDHAPSIVGG